MFIQIFVVATYTSWATFWALFEHKKRESKIMYFKGLDFDYVVLFGFHANLELFQIYYVMLILIINKTTNWTIRW